MDEPEDLHLTDEERGRVIAEHRAKFRQLGDRVGSDNALELLRMLSRVQVTRQKYADRCEVRSYEAGPSDDPERLRAVPETVRTVIAKRGGVVEGQTVRHMREWQGLRGDRSRGLLLLGPAGAGKTLHAALMLGGSVLEVCREGWIIGESLLSMHLSMGTKDARQTALAPLQSTPLLVVDYMGQPKTQTRWEAAVIEFLRVRWEAGKRCVLTFRGELDGFKRCYGADGWATVERFCTVLDVRRGI